MSNRYFIDLDISGERVTCDLAEEMIANAMDGWEPVAAEFHGGADSEFVFDTETRKVVSGKYDEYLNCRKPGEASRYIGMYAVMPSALWLYRLACVSKPIVNFEGREGYKVVWSAQYQHKSGLAISLYEWKGAFSMNVQYKGGKATPAQKKLVCAFLSMLCSEHLTHPYDGTVAGQVA